jgi:hypothetical protein
MIFLEEIIFKTISRIAGRVFMICPPDPALFLGNELQGIVGNGSGGSSSELFPIIFPPV